MTIAADGDPAVEASGRAIRARGLARRFGRRWALRDVDLEVEWGRAVALVGPNGSGKTTLLRILAGALTPTRGRARMAGHELPEDGNAVRCAAGLLAGDAYLYEDLTAAENLAFAVRMCGRRVSGAGISSELERVGLDTADGLRVRSFSSGMRKRLALARLLVTDRRILLLDEPYANLDQDGADLVDRIVADGLGEGRVLLVATHRKDRAEAVCDRTIRLVGGRRVDASSPAARSSRPGSGAGRAPSEDSRDPETLTEVVG